MELIFIIILFGVSAFNYYCNRNIMAPAMLFSLLWAGLLSLHAIFRITLLPDLFPLSLSTQLLFTAGSIAFSTGGFISAFFLFPKKNSTTRTQFPQAGHSAPISYIMRASLLLSCIAALPFYIKHAFDLFIKSQLDSFFQGLRYEISYGDDGMGPFIYLITLATVVFGLCQIETLRNPCVKNKVLAIVSTVVLIVYSVFSTSRTSFLTMGMLYLGIQIVYNVKFKPLKIFVIAAPIALILFTVYGLFFNKGGSLEASASENVSSSSQNTAVYLVGSLSAFDYDVNNQFIVSNAPYNSLRFFYVVGRAIGVIDPIAYSGVSTIHEFVEIPYLTNVFTIYSPYVHDYGYGYPLLILFLLGGLHTWLYILSMRGRKPNFALYYGFMLYPLIMSFFDDQYLSLFSMWLQTVIIVEATIFFDKLFLRKTSGAQALIAQSQG